jgi:hypothetical protein
MVPRAPARVRHQPGTVSERLRRLGGADRGLGAIGRRLAIATHRRRAAIGAADRCIAKLGMLAHSLISVSSQTWESAWSRRRRWSSEHRPAKLHVPMRALASCPPDRSFTYTQRHRCLASEAGEGRDGDRGVHVRRCPAAAEKAERLQRSAALWERGAQGEESAPDRFDRKLSAKPGVGRTGLAKNLTLDTSHLSS